MELLIRQLTPGYEDAMTALQQLVHDAMPCREQFADSTREEFREVLEEDFVFGAFDGDTLVAAAVCIRGRDTCYNLGQKCGFVPQECFTYDTVFVHPDYRGRGLQRTFAAMIEEKARQTDAASIWCTVAPGNRYSYDNLTKAGFEPYRRNVSMYGGCIRDILKKQL